ncbi:MAG: stimulus-sensing domain-containing protein, partial [Alphaproteobacteria bacterium]
THTRARLFAPTGEMLADTRALASGLVRIEQLTLPTTDLSINDMLVQAFEYVVNWLPGRSELPVYRELPQQSAADYEEVQKALFGQGFGAVRSDGGQGMVISVAVPVQRYKQIVGAVMLSTDSTEIEAGLRAVRLDIIKVSGVALAVTILLSLYLAATIARPLRRLAIAAERVRHGQGRQVEIPDFSNRGDEIGDLSRDLRQMTSALWQRMDAIEQFAADVAHEIKNPLTSLRSAVETTARVTDPEQQRRLMSIILEDVQRLDRLISDISDASRLDAELSRAETETLDLGQLLAALVEVERANTRPGAPQVSLQLPDGDILHAIGIEGRLGQVFRNVIANAVSFSPPDGHITCRAERDDGIVRVIIEDEGPGIPGSKLDAIFDRFYSDSRVGVSQREGSHSGLGLSISRQIIDAVGGHIWAENRRDPSGKIVGARFVVEVPAAAGSTTAG